jgi:hypothetical protein
VGTGAVDVVKIYVMLQAVYYSLIYIAGPYAKYLSDAEANPAATLPHCIQKKILAQSAIYLMRGAASFVLPLIYLILRSRLGVKIGP